LAGRGVKLELIVLLDERIYFEKLATLEFLRALFTNNLNYYYEFYCCFISERSPI